MIPEGGFDVGPSGGSFTKDGVVVTVPPGALSSRVTITVTTDSTIPPGYAVHGKVYRFAQIVAATALALEVSASAAMATAGSENFFRAHFERGGTRT